MLQKNLKLKNVRKKIVKKMLKISAKNIFCKTGIRLSKNACIPRRIRIRDKPILARRFFSWAVHDSG